MAAASYADFDSPDTGYPRDAIVDLTPQGVEAVAQYDHEEWFGPAKVTFSSSHLTHVVWADGSGRCILTDMLKAV
jgi:hypothetical protein